VLFVETALFATRPSASSQRRKTAKSNTNTSAMRLASRPTTLDILLRLKTQESRAMGVSGLQPGFCHLTGTRLTQSSWSAADWRCQTAVTPILSIIRLPSVFFASRESLTRLETWSYLAACSPNKHETKPSKIRVHYGGVSDTVSLVAVRPPPKAVRNRSVPT